MEHLILAGTAAVLFISAVFSLAIGKGVRQASVLFAAAALALVACVFVGQINPAWWR